MSESRGTVVVSFGAKWTSTVAAGSLFEAVRLAWAFFHDPFWKGPKPTLDTIFEVTVGAGKAYRTAPRKAGCEPSAR